MILVRLGRAVLLAGTAVLIVAVACHAAAAEPLLVPSDEMAHLPPTVNLLMRGEEAADDVMSPCEPLLAEAPRLLFSAEELANGLAHEVASPNADEPLAFLPDGELPPVVRAQSPSIALLPLATGEASIENTSLLSAVTGTKGRLRADYLTDFGGTDRIGVQALTQTWLGLGIDTEANYWQRPVPDLGSEPLWTGDLNLIYSFVPHPRFKLRSGAGAAWRVEDGKPHAGYNVTHGLDVYLLWRFMFSGELDWGAIDDDKLLHYRLALGLTWQGLEFFTGYDRYKLGEERLDGWVNGVQFWY